MSDNSELKPCPFCGSEAEFSSGYYNDLEMAKVCCTECDASIYMDSDDYPDTTLDEMETTVVNAWNRRAK